MQVHTSGRVRAGLELRGGRDPASDRAKESLLQRFLRFPLFQLSLLIHLPHKHSQPRRIPPPQYELAVPVPRSLPSREAGPPPVSRQICSLRSAIGFDSHWPRVAVPDPQQVLLISKEGLHRGPQLRLLQHPEAEQLVVQVALVARRGCRRLRGSPGSTRTMDRRLCLGNVAASPLRSRYRS